MECKALTTERLILRPFAPGDASAMYHNWASDPEVCRYVRFPPHRDEEESRSVIEMFLNDAKSGTGFVWALENKQDGTLIGSLGAMGYRESDASIELGYCIGQRWWGQGYTSEALGAVLRHLLLELGINRVEAYHSLENPASGRVMEKAGMQREGTCRQKYRASTGALQDCALYAILRQDLCL